MSDQHSALAIDDTQGQYELCQTVAAWAVNRKRRVGMHFFRTEDFSLDLAQDLFLQVPDILKDFDSERNVPLRAYLQQRLVWTAQRMVRAEFKWGAHTGPYEPNETVRSDEARGKRWTGNKQISILAPEALSGNRLVSKTMDSVKEACNALNIDDQRILAQWLEGVSQASIAEATGLSQSQVSRRINASLKKLRESMHKTA